jgi:uncharacterized protein (TIGR02231 family)
MKTKKLIHILLFLPVLGGFFFPSLTCALPRMVTFFPNSARVTDIIRVSPQTTGQQEFRVPVILPAQAVPDSLTTRLDPASGLKIDDLAWRKMNRQDDGRIADIQRQLQQAKSERIGVFSQIQSLDAQIQFWQAQANAKARTAEEINGLAAQIGRNVQKDLQEKLTLEPTLEQWDKRVRELQEELNQATGQKETVWEMTVTLRGSSVRETDLTLTYTLNECGWTPLYRLDAHPGERLIRFAWDAEIWQGSGMDWNQVDTELATLQPHTSLTPPDLRPWIIRPRPEFRMAKGIQRAEMMAAPSAPINPSSETQDKTEPKEARQTTYAVWTLGKKTIPAGARHRFKIRDENWQADFVHLLRPSLTPQAFVRATVKLPEGSELPSGAATFLIDGAVIGKRSFAFASQEGTFFFGIDPLVTARLVQLSSQSGQKGLIVDKQTQEWRFRIDLNNGGSGAIQARLEEPLPQPRDERIRISILAEPETSERRDSEMIWNLQIPGGQKRSLLNTIHLEAPKDMDLDLGWRR